MSESPLSRHDLDVLAREISAARSAGLFVEEIVVSSRRVREPTHAFGLPVRLSGDLGLHEGVLWAFGFGPAMAFDFEENKTSEEIQPSGAGRLAAMTLRHYLIDSLGRIYAEYENGEILGTGMGAIDKTLSGQSKANPRKMSVEEFCRVFKDGGLVQRHFPRQPHLRTASISPGDGGQSGVREPRRPITPSQSGGAALDLPE